MFSPALLLASLLAAASPTQATPKTSPASQPGSLQTHAEKTGFVETGRYEEVERLCRAFAARYPRAVRCEPFGTTPEGRPMLSLVASHTGALTPAAAEKAGLPVVLFQGGIHAGEIDGKDAGFLLLRELLESEAPENPLRKTVAVFVPVFNVDGHERFGPNQRPNQVGPAQMGWRVTSRNLNLNRDYAKADTPEMVALLGLLRRWDALVYLDLHVTDGAKFEHDVAVMIEPLLGGSELLRPLGLAARDAVFAELRQAGHLPLPFYPSFLKEDEPSSGFAAHVAPPRFSQGYWSLKNRFAALVETHSWRPYAHRVKTTRNVVLAFLRQAAVHGAAWRAAADRADAQDRAGIPKTLTLAYEPSGKHETFDFRGVAYEQVPSDVSGKKWIRYDEKRPQIWKVPYHAEVEPSVRAQVPQHGYVLPPGHAADIETRLVAHGLTFSKLQRPTPLDVEIFQATSKSFSAGSLEGRQTLKLEGGWQRKKKVFPAGSLWVPANQPGRRLVAHLFEPKAPDSFAAWGFFNPAFEQKEYIEDYVVEAEARKMMERDPALAAAFKKRLAEDPAFAGDPAARLRFFATRHPAWDAQLDVYPVHRVVSFPAGAEPPPTRRP